MERGGVGVRERAFLSRRLEVGLRAEEQEQAQTDTRIVSDRGDRAGVYFACGEVPAPPGFI